MIEDKDPLKLAFILIETIRQNLGLAAFIDAAEGTGMSHLGYTYWMRSAREKLGLSEDAVVIDGAIVEPDQKKR